MSKDRFVDWIVEYGIHNLIADFRMHSNTICAWRDRKYLPSVFAMRRIVKLSKGKVKYEDIIEPFFREESRES